MCLRKVVLKISITAHGLPQWLSGKESSCSVGDAEDASSIPPWNKKRSPGRGHGSSCQYSSLESPMDRSLAGCRVAKSQTRLKLLSTAHRVLLLILGDIIMIGLGM